MTLSTGASSLWKARKLSQPCERKSGSEELKQKEDEASCFYLTQKITVSAHAANISEASLRQ